MNSYCDPHLCALRGARGTGVCSQLIACATTLRHQRSFRPLTAPAACMCHTRANGETKTTPPPTKLTPHRSSSSTPGRRQLLSASQYACVIRNDFWVLHLRRAREALDVKIPYTRQGIWNKVDNEIGIRINSAGCLDLDLKGNCFGKET